MSSQPDRERGSHLRRRVAGVAARLIAEEGISNLALAKRKAARRLGLPENIVLPDDREVEAELRTYQRLFQDDVQEARNARLLRKAAALMTILQRFNPYLTGAVLEGMAGRYAEIDIQLIPDSTKDVEIFLLDQHLPFRHSVPRTDRAEAVLTLDDRDAIANLVIYPRQAERMAAKTRDGRTPERARLDVVKALLAATTAAR